MQPHEYMLMMQMYHKFGNVHGGKENSEHQKKYKADRRIPKLLGYGKAIVDCKLRIQLMTTTRRSFDSTLDRMNSPWSLNGFTDSA